SSIGSILSQTFTDFELLLVDDGSTDHSGEICDSFAAKDSRVIAFHKKNGGICSARNFGLKKARGTYIAFMDNDDEMFPNLLSDNYAIAVKNNCDLVRFGNEHWVIHENGAIEKKTYICPNRVYRNEDIYLNYLDFHTKFTKAVWTCLFRTEMLRENNIFFDESMKYGYEDRDFYIRTILVSNVIAGNDKAYYIWKQRETHSTSLKKGSDIIENRINSLLTIGNNEFSLIQGIGFDQFDKYIWEKVLGIYYIRTFVDILFVSGGISLPKDIKIKYWREFRTKLPKEHKSLLNRGGAMLELIKYNPFCFIRVLSFEIGLYAPIEKMYMAKQK
ncbi:MAG: glycosyltransferase, partial [Bacteroides sp.]|nr:glycosyltransferase [Bacteroides sp.]